MLFLLIHISYLNPTAQDSEGADDLDGLYFPEGLASSDFGSTQSLANKGLGRGDTRSPYMFSSDNQGDEIRSIGAARLHHVHCFVCPLTTFLLLLCIFEAETEDRKQVCSLMNQ